MTKPKSTTPSSNLQKILPNFSKIKDPIFRTAFWNLMNGIIGSGILSLPYAMANLGYLLFTVVLALVCALTLFSISNILYCCEKVGSVSYESLAFAITGKKGKYAVIGMIYVHTLIAMCSYVTVVKSQLPELIMLPYQSANQCLDKDFIFLDGNLVAFIVVLTIILPCCAMKKVDFLSPTSTLAMACICVFSVIIFVYQFFIECPFVENTVDLTDVENKAPLADHCLNWQEVRINNTKEYSPFIKKAEQISFYAKTAPSHIEGMSDDFCYMSAISDISKREAASAFPNLVFAFMCITTCFPIFGDMTESLKKRVCSSVTCQNDQKQDPNKEESVFIQRQESQVSNISSQYLSTCSQKGPRFYHCASMMQQLNIMTDARKMMTEVAKTTLWIVAFFYLLVALSGYNTWKEATVTSDILLPFGFTSPGNKWVVLARVCTLVTVVFSAPLLHYPCRRALSVLFFGHENDPNDTERFSWFRHLYIMVINLTIVMVIVTTAGKSIGQLFTYSGAVAANFLLLIMPSYLFMVTFKDSVIEKREHSLSSENSGKQLQINEVSSGTNLMEAAGSGRRYSGAGLHPHHKSTYNRNLEPIVEIVSPGAIISDLHNAEMTTSIKSSVNTTNKVDISDIKSLQSRKMSMEISPASGETTKNIARETSDPESVDILVPEWRIRGCKLLGVFGVVFLLFTVVLESIPK